MAIDIAGLFTSPEEVRRKRLDDIAKQQQAISQGGGSWDQLLGRVASQGSVVGSQLAEGAAGMFGLKTAEEDKAAQIQDMASNLNLETSQGKMLFARMLNNQGFTEQAMKMFEAGRTQEAQELDMEYKKKQLKNLKEDPDWEWKVVGKQYNPQTLTSDTVYAWVNRRTQEIKGRTTDATAGEEPAAEEEKVFILKPDGTLGQPRKSNEGYQEDIPFG